jgi:hypothetical protein
LADKTKAKDENLRSFKQLEFISEKDSGMAENGYIYVPDMCWNDIEKCRVHMFLHGCWMNEGNIGDAAYRHLGYNEWGESNGIIIIYPQTKSDSWLIYSSCWDAMGINDKFYDTKLGTHVKALFEISQSVERINLVITL